MPSPSIRSEILPKRSLKELSQAIIECNRCPRLRNYCRRVARDKRKAFRDETYWGRPVPGFGDFRARLLIIGLAPAAHGGNRTGRVFTGDSSGDFLFRALKRAGFANQPVSVDRNDGLRLTDAYITAVVRCAPPKNRPLPSETARCRSYLMEEFDRLKRVRAVLALGRIAFDGFLATLTETGRLGRRSGLLFRHGGIYDPGPGLPRLYASYHPSRQNTQTGRLTAAMLDRVMGKIRRELMKNPRGGAADRTPAP